MKIHELPTKPQTETDQHCTIVNDKNKDNRNKRTETHSVDVVAVATDPSVIGSLGEVNYSD